MKITQIHVDRLYHADEITAIRRGCSPEDVAEAREAACDESIENENNED